MAKKTTSPKPAPTAVPAASPPVTTEAPMDPGPSAADALPAHEGGPQGEGDSQGDAEAAAEAQEAPTAAQAGGMPEADADLAEALALAEEASVAANAAEWRAVAAEAKVPPFPPTVLRVSGRPSNGNAVELRRDDGTEQWGLFRQVRGGAWTVLYVREGRPPVWLDERDGRITLLPLAEAAELARSAV